MSKQNGFTLLELLIVTMITILAATLATPSVLRGLRQGEVDRYTQMLEAGIFSLRAKLGTSKTNCSLFFSPVNTFKSPQELIEVQQMNGGRSKALRIQCCNSSMGCQDNPSGFRIMDREGLREASNVSISADRARFDLSPPGTSAQSNTLTLLVRSNQWDHQALHLANGDSRLRTRCLQVTGSGGVVSGTWNENRCSQGGSG